jgi:hypothetical protein
MARFFGNEITEHEEYVSIFTTNSVSNISLSEEK